MFSKEVKDLLRGRPTSDRTWRYLFTIAKERFAGAELAVDLMTEAEDAVQGFLFYLQKTWSPRHQAYIDAATDEELAGRVVAVFHLWLNGRIETLRAEPWMNEFKEERARVDEEGEEKVSRTKVIKLEIGICLEKQSGLHTARERFEKFLHDHESAAVEWAKREDTGRWWKIWRTIEAMVRGNYSPEAVFEALLRVLTIVQPPKAPTERDLALAHFRAFLALNDEFSHAELAALVGVEGQTDYHSKLEKAWPGMKETAEGELEIRRLIEQVDPDTQREALEKRFENLLRKRAGEPQLTPEEVDRRRTDVMDLEAEKKADPENKDIF
ncbi:MAG: hypothetical protein ABFD52_00650 [Acidobacteriota bacterium]